MIKTLLLAALAAAGVGISLYLATQENTKRSDSAGYLNHLRKYKKFVVNPAEFEYRVNVFNDNIAFAESVNRRQSSFTAGENAYSDLTFEEFTQKYLSPFVIPHAPKKVTAGKKVKGSKDWTKENVVGPIKNQGRCGSCWAFSAIASLESAYAIKDGTHVSLAEQELVDCSTSYGNEGCNGGLMNLAFDYIKDNSIGLGSDYPYVARDQPCHAQKDKQRYTLATYKVIDPVDVSGLQTAIDEQPVSVAIEVQRDFQAYTGGIYKNDNCGQALNHGVAAVGYMNQDGVDSQYFIVRNSWGEGWGEKGYVRMFIGEGSGTCGIANDSDVYPQFN